MAAFLTVTMIGIFTASAGIDRTITPEQRQQWAREKAEREAKKEQQARDEAEAAKAKAAAESKRKAAEESSRNATTASATTSAATSTAAPTPTTTRTTTPTAPATTATTPPTTTPTTAPAATRTPSPGTTTTSVAPRTPIAATPPTPPKWHQAIEAHAFITHASQPAPNGAFHETGRQVFDDPTPFKLGKYSQLKYTITADQHVDKDDPGSLGFVLICDKPDDPEASQCKEVLSPSKPGKGSIQLEQRAGDYTLSVYPKTGGHYFDKPGGISQRGWHNVDIKITIETTNEE